MESMQVSFGHCTGIIGGDLEELDGLIRAPMMSPIPAAAPAGLYLFWPFDPRPIYITQQFGGAHKGLDVGIPIGVRYYNPLPIRSQIVWAGWNDQGYGNLLGLKSDALGAYVLIGHCSRVNPDLRAGQWVDPWAYLGESGSTGNSTGPHMHLEVRVPPYGYPSSCVNPYPLMRWRGPLPEPPPPPTPPPSGNQARCWRNTPIRRTKKTTTKIGTYKAGAILLVGNDNGGWTWVSGQHGQPDGFVKSAHLEKV